MPKRNKLLLFAIGLFTAALFLIAQSAQASAATKTWTGDGADNNFSTAGNWDPSVPENGDDLVFPADKATAWVEGGNVINDMSNLSLGGILVSGACVDETFNTFTIGGNDLTFTGNINNNVSQPEGASCDVTLQLLMSLSLGGDITITTDNSGSVLVGSSEEAKTLNINSHQLTLDNSHGLGIYSNVTGAGSIVTKGRVSLLGDNSGLSGTINHTNGELRAGSASSLGTSGLTLGESGALSIAAFQADTNISTPITMTGTGHGDTSNKITNTGMGCTLGKTITLSGLVTVNNSATFYSGCDMTLKITNAKLNGNTFSMAAGSKGTLIVNGEEIEADYLDVVIDEDSDAEVNYVVSDKIRVIVKANIPNYTFTVLKGGILAGTGITGDVTIQEGGKIAPGESPGCLSTGNITFEEGAIYEFEIGGTTVCSQYDQIDVTGTVTINDGTLDIVLLDSYDPKTGDSFVIIKNDGSDAVEGSFADLPEGTIFESEGVVFQITYAGGSGNDVVLTVQEVPDAADTGFQMISSNPFTALTVTTLLAGAIYAIHSSPRIGFFKK